jgi:hypothetical protein
LRGSVVGWSTVGGDLRVALTAWQALRGQSLVRPDAPTWTVAAALAVAAVTAVAATIGHARRRTA